MAKASWDGLPRCHTYQLFTSVYRWCIIKLINDGTDLQFFTQFILCPIYRSLALCCVRTLQVLVPAIYLWGAHSVTVAPANALTMIAGLDTYFFLNLSVGQPSNNMDLSEVEIYLGTIKIFFLFRKKKSGRTLYLYIQFLFQDYCVWSTPSHNKSLVFFSRSFFCPLWRHRDQEYISRDIKNV